MIYFVSDTHCDHRNVIYLCNRPFVDIFDHDEQIIKNWNKTVGKDDEVYHLGDFAWSNVSRAESIVIRLNGRKHWITGNHDKPRVVKDLSKYFESVQTYKELSVNNRMYVLCHYPFESWRNSCHGSINFHGHCHSKMRIANNRLDVGVDNVFKLLGSKTTEDYRPISLNEALLFIEAQNVK